MYLCFLCVVEMHKTFFFSFFPLFIISSVWVNVPATLGEPIETFGMLIPSLVPKVTDARNSLKTRKANKSHIVTM